MTSCDDAAIRSGGVMGRKSNHEFASVIRLLFVFTVLAAYQIVTLAQTSPRPKQARPTVTLKHQPADLVERFARLSCAVFEIDEGSGQGSQRSTGFFVGPNGEFVTAAHVIAEDKFSKDDKTQQLMITPVPYEDLTLVKSDGARIPIHVSFNQEDWSMVSADLYRGKVETESPCYLKIGNSTQTKIGAAVLSIGYPNLSPSLALSEGFISSRYKHLPKPLPTGGSWDPNYEVLRIQMPVIAGASGSPVIADDDSVIGVVSEIPVLWTKDLQRGLEFYGQNIGGMSLGDFNTTTALVDLIFIVRQFESPGFGLAVPTEYLQGKH